MLQTYTFNTVLGYDMLENVWMVLIPLLYTKGLYAKQLFFFLS